MSIVYGGDDITFDDATKLASSPMGKNLIIDPSFTINQRAYVSAATLASGLYGHDRWKAGASGGDYSFTQLANTTVITIASGKTLIQVIEDKNVYGGTYTLSWTGTAQGRFTKNSATPSGAYADSPITITGQTTGTTMSVEFDDGTLSDVQVELGTIKTLFEHRLYGQELALCQRYYERHTAGEAFNGFGIGVNNLSSTRAEVFIKYNVPKRIPVTAISTGGNFRMSSAATVDTAVTFSLFYGSTEGITIRVNSLSLGADGDAVILQANNDVTAYIDFTGEL